MMRNDPIVISGIAGRFPECENVEKFKQALLNGINMITEDGRRFPQGVFKTPKGLGKLPTINKFDASFFGVHPKQAASMNPCHRLVLETTYECLIDAGYNPKELRGSRTGVYVGINSFSNGEEVRRQKTEGYSNLGLCSAISANRISFCFNFKGPSFSLDTACSSSMYAFVNAMKDLESGEIENAIVCGTHLVLHPHESMEFNNLNMLSHDGICRVFDTKRYGYGRSEAVASFLLQKKSQSRRIYATVLGAKSNCDGYKNEGITFPSSDVQLELMKELYCQYEIDPNEVVYVEAHGTGTRIGDHEECKTILSMFCEKRKNPLPIGSVKSNMGHSEISSGLCSMTKVIIAMETGIIPANINFVDIDTTLPGLGNNKIKVVTENLPWNGGIVGVNSFGFGGANAHIAIESFTKEKSSTYTRPRHRLVQVSGRTEEAVNYFLDQVEAGQDDEEFLALVDEIHKMNVDGHPFRGYTVLSDKPVRDVGRYIKSRPIWFIYSGMGSQWISMGRDLLSIEIFRKTFLRCAAALKPYNIDLEDIVTNTSPSVYDDNITNAFCGIGAIQFGLTDVLRSFEIFPDGIAGHSLGEVGTSYADGKVTPEEAILLLHARGYASIKSKPIPGLMAAIGMSKEKCRSLLPSDITLACMNSKTNVTISGPAESVKSFVEKLNNEGIFARIVSTGGIAYHSKYVADAGQILFDMAKEVLKNPELRSPKWVSSSVPANQANETWTKYNCAEYHHNNFVNPVLFDQVYQYIPDDAVVVEVAPHGLLQAILKRELSPNTTHISLANRSHDDNEQYLLAAIGKIYLAGGQPNLRNFYNEVTFPVSRGTKMLSPLVKWDHNVSWFTPLWRHMDSYGSTVTVNLSDEKYSHFRGHEIDGRTLMPATAYLCLVWEVLAGMVLKEITELPVVMENIKFQRSTILPLNEDVQFLINIMKQSGNFEIFESGFVVASGRIRIPTNVSNEFSNTNFHTITTDQYLKMRKQDFYKECHLRKYMYQDLFQGITECDIYGLSGQVEWKGKFDSFMDAMIQLTLLYELDRLLVLPTFIQKIVIDPTKHLELVKEATEIPINANKNVNVLKSGAIQITGLGSTKATRHQKIQNHPLLEKYNFITYNVGDTTLYDYNTLLTFALQIVLQNCTELIKRIKICQIVNSKNDQLFIADIENILKKQPMVDAEYIATEPNNIDQKYDIIVLTENVLSDMTDKYIQDHLYDLGFILFIGEFADTSKLNLQIIFQANNHTDGIYLLRPTREFPNDYSILNISNSNFEWINKLKNIILEGGQKIVYLFSQGEEVSGIVGLVKCLFAEHYDILIRLVFINTYTEIFSVENKFYKEQLSKNLTFNILKDGRWGTFVHSPLDDIQKRAEEDASISILTTGDLSTLNWVQKSPIRFNLGDKSELVYVFYSSLNFRDVMVATGKLQLPWINDPTAPEVAIGFEYSGITKDGNRVMGLTESEGLSLQVRSESDFTWEVPKSWTLEDAATIPSVYSTCYYALIVRGQMQPRESILIHAGTGGIGMAAISIALSMDCIVFTTVGTEEKRQYLTNMFPSLKCENIGNSRNDSFENMIMENTDGRGVDVILNSLSENLFQASIRCIANKGRFLEIGKVDFFNRTPIDSSMFLKNCSFHGILLDELMESHGKDKSVVRNLVQNGILTGVVKPLPRTVFAESEVETAFRFLASGKHKGKVLIKIREETSGNIKSPRRTILSIPRTYFDSNKSYILIGGLGGFGLELTTWMIRRGATKIILNSRRNISNGYQSYCLMNWARFEHVKVKVNTDDTTTSEGAEKLIRDAQTMGPVGGVFNIALVLKDGFFQNQTKSDYISVFNSKIVSVQHMDKLTRKLCSELNHFVAFSSIASGRGNFGQTNYAMANSAIERLCEKRKSDNLPGLAIQWGPIGDVGALDKIDIKTKVMVHLLKQNITSCLKALDDFMLQSEPVVSSVVLADANPVAKLAAKSPAEAVSHILGINDLDAVDKSVTLSQLGLDSLMVAEVNQTLYRNYQMELSTDEIRNMTFEYLLNLDNAQNSVTIVEDIINRPKFSVSPMICKESIVMINDHRESDNDKIIFFLHPIEGNVRILEELAKRLKVTVYGLQCTAETDYDNIKDFARYFIEQIRIKQPKGPYFLFGYSYGGTLALEVGLQLERNDEMVKIISLDGSPAYMKNIVATSFATAGKSLNKSREEIMKNFCLCFDVNQKRISKLLEAPESWQNKVLAVSNFVSQETGEGSREIAISFERYYKRCCAGYFYEPTNIFKGDVLLIRRRENSVLPDDYDLQRVCEQPIKIVKLDGDHMSILLGDNTDKIAHIIIKTFEKCNCELNEIVS